jgi:hypothetical protein
MSHGVILIYHPEKVYHPVNNVLQYSPGGVIYLDLRKCKIPVLSPGGSAYIILNCFSTLGVISVLVLQIRTITLRCVLLPYSFNIFMIIKIYNLRK